MQRTVSVLAAAALGIGLAVVGVAAPASAHTPSVTADCNSIDLALVSYETKPAVEAVYETVVTKPAVAEVSHTDYEYRPLFGSSVHWAHKNEGLTLIYDWTLYYATGNTRTHVEVPAVPAETEERLVTPAQEADDAPNTVTVTVDGEVVESAAFGESYTGSIALDKYTEQQWSVDVVGYTGVGTETFSGTSGTCATGPINAAGSITAECGVATLELSNEALSDDAVNGTYAAVVTIDGAAQPADVIAVFENGIESKRYEFAEDTGEHTIVARTGSAQGNALIAEATVDTDCIENEVPGGGTETPGTDSGTPGEQTPGTGTEEPGTDEPGTGTPGTEEPGTETPGTDEGSAPAGEGLAVTGGASAPAGADDAEAGARLASTGANGDTLLALALAFLALAGIALAIPAAARRRA